MKKLNRQLPSINSKIGVTEVFISLLELILTSQGMKALALEESHLAMAVLGMLDSMVFDLVEQILLYRSIQTGVIVIEVTEVIEVIATIVNEEIVIVIVIGAETLQGEATRVVTRAKETETASTVASLVIRPRVVH